MKVYQFIASCLAEYRRKRSTHFELVRKGEPSIYDLGQLRENITIEVIPLLPTGLRVSLDASNDEQMTFDWSVFTGPDPAWRGCVEIRACLIRGIDVHKIVPAVPAYREGLNQKARELLEYLESPYFF